MNTVPNAAAPIALAEAPGAVFLSRSHNQATGQVSRHGDVSLVLDGEIYEAEGLTLSGTEQHQAATVLRMYERMGLAFLEKVVGSFYLALSDPKAEQVVLAVDPFATRPLYYSCANGRLAFASEVSSFSESPEITKEIDPNVIYFFLNHSFVPAPYTIYRQVHRLQPGQYLLWKRRQLSVHQYWDMSYDEEESMDESEAARLIRDALEESVRRRLQYGAIRNGQFGAFLSGGTDSSTLVGLMSRVTGRPIKTFSIGFDEESYNEIEYARIASRHFNTQAYEHFVRSREAFDVIPFLAKIYDEPFGNSSAISAYFCLRMAGEAGVKVMFAGDGGDELFAGNEHYRSEKILSLYQEIPARMRKWMDFVACRLPPFYPLSKVRSYVQRANRPNPERVLSYELYVRDHASEFFNDEFIELVDPDFALQVPRRHYEKTSSASPVNRLLYLDLKMAIGDNDLFKVNRMAGSLGIGVRYPYLDQYLACVSGKIPTHLKMKGLNKRYIFKEAFRDLLPRETLLKKKHGFGLPTGDWLRRDRRFRDLAHSLLLDARSLQRGYFKRGALERLLRSHAEEKSNYYGSIIWNIMMLELWHRNHVD